jgi:hypothetical protein
MIPPLHLMLGEIKVAREDAEEPYRDQWACSRKEHQTLSSSRAQKDLGPFSGRPVEEFNQSS